MTVCVDDREKPREQTPWINEGMEAKWKGRKTCQTRQYELDKGMSLGYGENAGSYSSTKKWSD